MIPRITIVYVFLPIHKSYFYCELPSLKLFDFIKTSRDSKELPHPAYISLSNLLLNDFG